MIQDTLSDSEQPQYPEVPAAIHRELYALADWAMRTEPWKRMTDSHVIAINDPKGGEPWLMSVMGNAGELFALHVYLPEEGTRWYTRFTIEGETPETFSDAQFKQRLVSLTFNDGFDDNIDEHDEELDELFAPLSWEDGIGNNDLDFVQIRAHLPGRPPWHPDEEHARILLTALRLLKDYYEGTFKKRPGPTFLPGLHELERPGCVLLPTYTLPAGADADDPKQWGDTVEFYKYPSPNPVLTCPADDIFVGRLASIPVVSSAVWEIGAIYSPEPFLQDGIPRFAVVAFVAIRGVGTVHGMTLSAAENCIHTRIRQCLEAAAKERGVLPAKIVVGSDIARDALSDLAAARHITLTKSEAPGEMSAFDAAASSMRNSASFAGDISPEEAEDLRRLLDNAPSPESDPEGFMDFLKDLSEKPQIAPLIDAFLESPDAGLDDLLSDDSDTPDYILPQSTTRYVLRIDIAGAKPPLWRRISIPSDASFFDLHLAIQAVFGWSGDHLHSFECGRGLMGRTTIDWLNNQDSASDFGTRSFHELFAKIADHFTAENKVWDYVYDFGDNWVHRIKWEKTIKAQAPGDGSFFDIIKGSGAHPIEDCGGIHAHKALLFGDHMGIEYFDPEILAPLEANLFDPTKIHIRDPKTEIAMLDQMNDTW